MSIITGIQQRKPYSHSGASSSNYNHPINTDEFVINKYKDNRIRIFFKQSTSHRQGVGLDLPSADIATSLARAILMVSEGYSNNVTIST